MIDITKEKLIRLEDVRDYIPSSRKGKKLGKAVIFRWAGRGIRGIVLETIRCGGARITSAEAIQRFVEAQNQTPHHASAVDSRKAVGRAQKASAELSKLGIR